MKITLYTVTDCEFSKQEKEYLTSHTLAFEEKNLEQNKEWLTEMLTVGNNFAGTPVTRIEKDNGQTVVLKGFTKTEFDEALGFTQAEAAPSVVPPPVAEVPAPIEPPAPPAPMDIPVSAAPVEPVMPEAPAMPDLSSITPPAAPVAPTPAPSAPAPVASPQDQQLNDLLSSLQTKAAEPAPAAPPAPVVSQTPAGQSAAPATTPQIPDFH